MKKINNILFDLGGVLIDIDYNRPVQAFSQLGFHHFEEQYSQVAAGPLFIELEKGHISPDEFFQNLQELGPGSIPTEQLEAAWNSILLDFRLNSLALLERLQKKYRLFLLSNTNAIHHQAFSEIFQRLETGKKLDDYFEKAYYSHLIGERKPESSAFNYVVRDAGILPEETLFIDDTPENIEAAEKLGFRTIWLQKGSRVEDWEGTEWLI